MLDRDPMPTPRVRARPPAAQPVLLTLVRRDLHQRHELRRRHLSSTPATHCDARRVVRPAATFCENATTCTGSTGQPLTCRATCRSDADCEAPGDCIPAQQAAMVCRPTAAPGSSCLANLTRCTGGTSCSALEGEPLTCARTCQRDADCAMGTSCIAAQLGQRLCAPTATAGETCTPSTLCLEATVCTGAAGGAADLSASLREQCRLRAELLVRRRSAFPTPVRARPDRVDHPWAGPGSSVRMRQRRRAFAIHGAPASARRPPKTVVPSRADRDHLSAVERSSEELQKPDSATRYPSCLARPSPSFTFASVL